MSGDRFSLPEMMNGSAASLERWTKSLGAMFRPGYPFPQQAWKEAMPSGEQIAEYVQNTIRNATEWMTQPGRSPVRRASTRTARGSAAPAARTCQTRRSVLVRVRLPGGRSGYPGIRVAHDPNAVYIRGIGGKTMRVLLPSPVRTRGGHARIRNGVLEIRLGKARRGSYRRREIWVQY